MEVSDVLLGVWGDPCLLTASLLLHVSHVLSHTTKQFFDTSWRQTVPLRSDTSHLGVAPDPTATQSYQTASATADATGEVRLSPLLLTDPATDRRLPGRPHPVGLTC